MGDDRPGPPGDGTGDAADRVVRSRDEDEIGSIRDLLWLFERNAVRDGGSKRSG
jgi:hypothetical protein